MNDDDAKKHATAEGGSIYKAVKRMLDGNLITRADIMSTIERVAFGRVSEWLKSYWGERRLSDAITREIQQAVQKEVATMLQQAVWSKRLTLTIEPKDPK